MQPTAVGKSDIPAEDRLRSHKDPLPRTDAEGQGFSAERLRRLDARMEAGVQAGEIPGAVVLVARNGKLAYSRAFGYAAVPAGIAMTEDTVFSLMSLTKPVTSVAAMVLVEEGLLCLDEPVSRYLPELRSLKVLRERVDASGKVTRTLEPARREPTVQDLFRHTSGFVYGQFGNGPVHQAYMEANVWSTGFDVPLAETITRLAAMPLASEPGTTFEYSISTDVLGRVIEVVSGQSLDAFIEEHIGRPLGLETLKFHVSPGAPYAWDPIFDPLPASSEPNPLRAAAEARKRGHSGCLSGGGGMFSTAGDYLRFAQMLLNDGQLEGKRILSAKSVMLMRSNHLPPGITVPDNIRALLRLIAPTPEMGQGFGLGLAVRTAAGRNPAPGSVGDFYWGGASGTYFWADPEQQLIAVSFTAQSRFETKVLYRQLLRQLVYQALEDVYPARPDRLPEQLYGAEEFRSPHDEAATQPVYTMPTTFTVTP